MHPFGAITPMAAPNLNCIKCNPNSKVPGDGFPYYEHSPSATQKWMLFRYHCHVICKPCVDTCKERCDRCNTVMPMLEMHWLTTLQSYPTEVAQMGLPSKEVVYKHASLHCILCIRAWYANIHVNKNTLAAYIDNEPAKRFMKRQPTPIPPAVPQPDAATEINTEKLHLLAKVGGPASMAAISKAIDDECLEVKQWMELDLAVLESVSAQLMGLHSGAICTADIVAALGKEIHKCKGLIEEFETHE
jgi:hypothetical protein